jgi:histidinol-phosphate aminotransferase
VRAVDDPRALVRPEIRTLAGYTPGEQATGYTKLNTNECAHPPSPAVARGLAEFSTGCLRVYPSPRADALRQVAATTFGVAPDMVLAGNGSDDLLTILVRTFVGAGESIATPAPTYGLYDVLAGLQGARLVSRPYGPDWALPGDLGDLGAKLVFVSNPNNPSATLSPPEEILAIARRREAIVVVDEAYADFAGETLLGALGEHPNLVVLRTFSKSYALAGARLGLLFADARIVHEMMKVKDSYNVNAVSQVIGIAALEDRAHHRALVDATLAERAWLESALASVSAGALRWPKSAANFLLVDVGSRETASSLYLGLKARRILVRYWDRPRLDTSLRITVGTREENTALVGAIRDLFANREENGAVRGEVGK